MNVTSLAAACGGVVLAVGGLALAGAPAASADMVWHQSVGRSGPTAACPASSSSDLALGWTEWTGSWASWVNSGKGGYVCNRSIVWAQSSPPPSGCVWVGDAIGGSIYLNFGDSDYLSAENSVVYLDAACATPLSLSSLDLPVVNVSGPTPEERLAAAEALCDSQFDMPNAGVLWSELGGLTSGNDDVFICSPAT